MHTNKALHRCATAFILSCCLILASPALLANNGNGVGQGKGAVNGQGQGSNIGFGNASDGIKGKILTRKHIYYTGDPLEIRLLFPRGAGLVRGGEADASLVIFAPETDTATVLPVSSEASENERVLFSIGAVDISTLPAGQYQLGLILTAPGGDPLNVNDWHGGLLGLIDVVGITVTDESLDMDSDGDGMVDDDEDGDGFEDDDEEEEEEESEDEISDDSADDSTDSTDDA